MKDIREFAAVIAAMLVLAANIARTVQPNIILVLMDNFGWGEIG